MGLEFTSVKREIYIHAAPERAWRALTVPEERNRWETRQCKIDLVVGGQVELDYGWGVSYTGTIRELVVNELLDIEDENRDLTRWTLTPQGGGTVVGIEYTGFWAGDMGLMGMDNMAFGTYQFMRNMKRVLEGEADIRDTFWNSWIGVNHRTLYEDGASGSSIVEVIPHTPADGILHVGDILVRIQDKSVIKYDDAESLITSVHPGTILRIVLLRAGDLIELDLITVPFGKRVASKS
ncbi:SRPBCC domain-containing protein [Paenibacillus terrigena]|uniref:SRPBCC domain-containing protein n=1 Tax=Paenibacillus terrigena TaxID=369333 RepID=UPI0028D3C39A|nr:SRPBCC domain-containing protein [Paenibacillus terrigena]